MTDEQTTGFPICAALVALALIGVLSGCMVKETRPLAKIHPIQPTAAIPQDELLDVGIHVFDPNLPEGIDKDTKEQDKKRIYPDVRRAEARFQATLLRNTLEDSGQWGAVRVVPATAEFVDVTVDGRILRSDGQELSLEITVTDVTGRRWIDKKKYGSPADIGSYMSDAALKQRDPFQNVYSEIANDMLAARQRLTADSLRGLRRVTEVRFAQDLAPQAFDGYLTHDTAGHYLVARLPADNDPVFERVQRIRERDGSLVDTVSDYYDGFANDISEPYGNWRRASYDELSKEQKLKSQARTRIALGAAAIIGGILAASHCGATAYGCQRAEDALRYGAYGGGIAGIVSGLKKGADAKIHTAAVKELANSFQGDVAPRVVEVEGRTLKLTGTAEEQYRQWRKLLHKIYLQDTGQDVDQQVAEDSKEIGAEGGGATTNVHVMSTPPSGQATAPAAASESLSAPKDAGKTPPQPGVVTSTSVSPASSH